MSFGKYLIAPVAELPKAWLVILGVGLFVQLSGLLYNNDGSRYATQTYLLLFLPSLALLLWRRLALDIWRQTPGVVFLSLLGWVLFFGFIHPGSSEQFFYWLKITVLILLYVFTVATLARHENALTWLLLATVGVAAMFAWSTFYYQYGVLDKTFEYQALRNAGRLSKLGWHEIADLKHPITAGLYYGVFVVILTYLLVGFNVRGWKAVLIILALLGVLGYVILTFSRGAWFSTAVSCFVLLLFFPNLKSRSLMVAALLSSAAVIYGFWPEIQYELERGVSNRDVIWSNWVERLPEFWLVGNGAGADFLFRFPAPSRAVAFHAHSLYLQLWYEYGLVGMFLFVLALSSLLWKGWACRSEPLARLGFALLIFAIVAMVSDVYAIFHRPSPYWAVLWFPVGILLGIQPRQAHEAIAQAA